MPELPEVEAYRLLAERVIGRTVADVVVPDPWYLKRGVDPIRCDAALRGRAVAAARRRGSCCCSTSAVARRTLGLRFGMTGRLVVDGRRRRRVTSSTRATRDASGVGPVRLSGSRTAVDWCVRDPRRLLGGVELDPDERRARSRRRWSSPPAELRRALEHGDVAPLKARLHGPVAVSPAIGNLIADEVLWRAGLDQKAT